MMNALTARLFAAMDVDVEAFALCEIDLDTCLVTPPVSAIEVHYVIGGTLHFSVAGGLPLVLREGSIVVTPAGMPQRLAGTSTPRHDVAAQTVCASGREGMMLFDATETGTGALRIFCGKIRADIAGSVGPLEGLAAPIAAELGDSPFVRAAFETMADELRIGTVGARVIVSSLMKACLVVLMRHHLADTAQRSTAPSLLDQPRLARAVAEIVANPAVPHSVASLACEAGMSRSAFAKSFRASLGMTPMEFVSRTRMVQARNLLVSSGLSVSAIAARVGLASRSHFSRVFRNYYGYDPSAFRRRHQSDQSCFADRDADAEGRVTINTLPPHNHNAGF